MLYEIKWNDDWRKELEKTKPECYIRLCECRNTKADVILMAKLMYKYNSYNTDPEDCFIRMIEWVGDWNNQFNIMDYFYASEENYQKALDKIKKI